MIDFLIGAGLVVCVLLMAGLARQSRVPERIWAQIWFAMAAAGFLFFLLARNAEGLTALVFASISSTALSALLPVQYMHVRQATGAPVRVLWPHAAVPVFNILLILLVNGTGRAVGAEGVVVTSLPWGNIVDFATILISLGLSLYSLASIRRLRHAQQRLTFQRRRASAAVFNWLIAWCAGSFLFLLSAVIVDAGSILGVVSVQTVGLLGFGSLTAQVVLVGIYSSVSSRALDALPLALERAPEPDLERLAAFMRETRPYLEAGLSSERLSEAMDWPLNRLTQAIRASGAAHFNDYLNRWRVDAVSREIERGDNRSLLELALDAGFGSKSSFNDAFKRHTGLSPTEYRKRLETGKT